MSGYFPPLVLLLFGAWAGTFAGGAGFAGSTTGVAVLLGVALAFAVRGETGPDPLGLGAAGRWLPAALLVSIGVSWWLSPVPRAGRTGLMLLPAYLLLPGAVATAWGSQTALRRGLRAVSAGVAAIACWALADLLSGGSPRAAVPLGHHNLLALWLLAVLPLAVLPVRERTAWRWLGGAAGVAGIAALLATRSLLGVAGLLALVALAVLAGRVRGASEPHRRRRWVRLVVLGTVPVWVAVLAALFLPRVVEVAGGRDPSLRARAVYWRGGLEGFLERPWLGWGPGATPWTLGEHLRPRPGVNPPGEVVGQLHSQPLQLLYELGALGLGLGTAILAVFGVRRWHELNMSRRKGAGRGGARDPAVAFAGLAGLLASGVAALGEAALDVAAVPVALAVAAGAALAGGSRGGRESSGEEAVPPFVGPRRSEIWRVGYGLYAVAALALSIAPARAHLHYQRSLTLDRPAAAREMAAAAALDPSFPWYRAWASWLGGTGPLGRRSAAEPMLEAARDAQGVAVLWLMAGVSGIESHAPWADRALAHACRLDPFGPLAPFYRMVANPGSPRAPVRGARALLAEPRLLAATFWRSQPELRVAALGEIETWPAVPAGWKVAFLETAERLDRTTFSEPPQLVSLSAVLDSDTAVSLALHLFRRSPRALRLAPVAVDGDRAEAISLPPASMLVETRSEAFDERGCGDS